MRVKPSEKGPRTSPTEDPVVRVAEIRQENGGGGVAARDIDWLCHVADSALTYLAYGDPGPGYDERVARHLRKSLRKVLYRG